MSDLDSDSPGQISPGPISDDDIPLSQIRKKSEIEVIILNNKFITTALQSFFEIFVDNR